MDFIEAGADESLAASAARDFGLTSFVVRGGLVGGELKGGGSTLLRFVRTAEQLGVHVFMVSGPTGTLRRIEAGAISAARAQGAGSVEINASLVKDSIGRLLRRNGFTQEMKGSQATGTWIKLIRLKQEAR